VNYHLFAVSLGWVAVALTVWGSAAQFQRIRTHGIEGVSLATWTLFALMGCFWIIYGVEQRSPVIILGSLLVLPLQVAVVLRLSPWRDRPTLARVGSLSFVACVLPTMLWGWSGGVYGAGVVMVITRGPQLIELVRTRNATGVSVSMWMLGVTALLCWVVYYQNQRLWAPFASTTCGGLASLAIALLALWRHRQFHAELVVDEVSVAQS
jgi:uncharacterized protein with PQ loop repeat